MTWFISNGEHSEGPYSADRVRELVNAGQVTLDCLIWGRSLEKWISVTQWMSGDFAQKTSQANPEGQTQWHYALNGVSKGPMGRAELVRQLSDVRDKDLILVWTKGMQAWADIYEFPDFIAELGLNRREQPRVPIKGTATLKPQEGGPYQFQLRTIGTGGIGISGGAKDLHIGDSVHIEMQSPSLGAETLSVKGSVQYTTTLGFVGVRFEAISQEMIAKIQEHVNATRIPVPTEKAAA